MLREVGAFFVNQTVVVFGFLGGADSGHAEDHQEGQPEERLNHESWTATSSSGGLAHNSLSIIEEEISRVKWYEEEKIVDTYMDTNSTIKN